MADSAFLIKNILWYKKMINLPGLYYRLFYPGNKYNGALS
jgi:hypothetical protein